MYLMSNIYTNAVDLAKMIDKLKARNMDFVVSIVKGIDNEDVVRLDWKYVEDEED